MRSFDYTALANKNPGADVLASLAAINRAAGRLSIYRRLRPGELAGFSADAAVKGTAAAAALAGLSISRPRIRQLGEQTLAPRSRDEQQAAGYRDALEMVRETSPGALSQEYILRLHKVLFARGSEAWAGRTKSVQNYFRRTFPDGQSGAVFAPLGPFEVARALDRICEEYNRTAEGTSSDPLLIIPVFLLDFVCIWPFNEGNERIALLLAILMLNHCGFPLGDFISLEAYAANDRESLLDALAASQHWWHEEENDVLPFVRYFLRVLAGASADFEERFSLSEPGISALEAVKTAAHRQKEGFTKQDIRDYCPFLSLSSVEAALRSLTSEGFLKRQGTGKGIWYELSENRPLSP